MKEINKKVLAAKPARNSYVFLKKWITLFVFLLFATTRLTAGGHSKKEEPTKPAAKVVKPSEPEKKAEDAKPAEAKPATQIVQTIFMRRMTFNDEHTKVVAASTDKVLRRSLTGGI